MHTVYKYTIKLSDSTTIFMPAGAKILHVDDQHGTPCLWALVDPAAGNNVPRKFRVVGTGHPIPDLTGLQHVGSVLAGSFVWHIFEIIES